MDTDDKADLNRQLKDLQAKISSINVPERSNTTISNSIWNGAFALLGVVVMFALLVKSCV